MSDRRRPLRSASAARPVIDTGRFTRADESLSGEVPVARLARLSELLADTEGSAEWALAGGRRRRPEGGSVGRLQLAWGARVRVTCVRCLQPLELVLDGSRDYRLALTESLAQREDAEDDEFDVLAENPALDVLDLLEDELILAVPYAAAHDACVTPAGADGPAADPS